MHPHVTAQTPALSGERDFSQVFQTPSEVRVHLASQVVSSALAACETFKNVSIDLRMYAVNRACLKELELDICQAQRKANCNR